MDDKQSVKAPILSFQTFWTFLGDVAAKPLPPQIDRSMLSTKTGTDQANLLAATRFFGLINEDLSVPADGRLARLQQADEDGRKAILGEMVTDLYPDQMAVSATNGTDKLLSDSFHDAFGYSGDTTRKAKTFFLHAARTAGIPLSPYFPKTRSGPGSSAGSGDGTARKKPRRTGKNKDGSGTRTQEQNPPPVTPPAGDTYKVTLHCGGSVTLTVAVSHFDLSRDRDDRKFVNDLIDALTDYGDVETTEGETVAPQDVETDP